jgi:AraC-like DNA-binding protein
MNQKNPDLDYSAIEQEEFLPFGELPANQASISKLLEATRILPVSARSWQCTRDWQQYPRRVPEVMWFCFERGSGWIKLGEDLNSQPATPVQPGDLFLIPKGMLHQVKPDPGVAFDLHTIHFFAELYGTIDLIAALNMGGHYRPAQRDTFLKPSRNLARECGLRAPGFQKAMESGIWQVLLETIREHGSRMSFSEDDQLTRIKPVLDLVEARLADPYLKIASLAEEIHISQPFLRRLFAQVLGVSPITFIRLKRVERACLLLKSSNLPIKAIVGRCGFRDLPFFYRTFNRFVGSTPNAYRQASDI